MTYCLFQGTFNPIHNAHLRVAEYVIRYGYAKNIIFVPALFPPHKIVNNISPEHRLNMVKIATGYNSKFSVSDIEYKRGGKSYTFLTIKEIYKALRPNDKIKFIIGTDAFKKIKTWYLAEELKSLIDFLVFIRENDFSLNSLNDLKNDGYNYELLPLEYCNISSTLIRDNIKNGISVSALIPESVEEYIIKNELYRN